MDPFDFMLAEKLGLTLAQVGAMANREYLAWRAWHVYVNAMQDMK